MLERDTENIYVNTFTTIWYCVRVRVCAIKFLLVVVNTSCKVRFMIPSSCYFVRHNPPDYLSRPPSSFPFVCLLSGTTPRVQVVSSSSGCPDPLQSLLSEGSVRPRVYCFSTRFITRFIYVHEVRRATGLSRGWGLLSYSPPSSCLNFRSLFLTIYT